MTAPTAKRASAGTAAGPFGSAPDVNPRTGLSTDYVNHFTEAVMALEMAAVAPDCLEDLRAWRPKSYVEHFAGSRLSRRAAVIDAYRAADRVTRDALDATSAALNAAILDIRDAVLAGRRSPAADARARRACAAIRPRIAGLAALINGATAGCCESGSTQAEIDAMFGR